MSRKRGPSSEPREESGAQELAVGSSDATAPPKKKDKETALYQMTTQDTIESTAVPAVPASPEIPDVRPEPVAPKDNVNAPSNVEEIDASLVEKRFLRRQGRRI